MANGRHLIIDAEVKDSKVFSHENLEKMFKTLVKNLDMQILHGPIFKDVEFDPSKLTGDAFQDEGGTTGIVVIKCSHIAIHTWGLRNFFSMDVYSCKDFDTSIALTTINKFMKIKKISLTNVLRRGANQTAVISEISTKSL